MDGRTDGRTDGRMNGRLDGQEALKFKLNNELGYSDRCDGIMLLSFYYIFRLSFNTDEVSAHAINYFYLHVIKIQAINIVSLSPDTLNT